MEAIEFSELAQGPVARIDRSVYGSFMDTTGHSKRGIYWAAKSPDEKRLQVLILDTLRDHGAFGWTVIFGRQTGSMGYCEYSKKEICISRRVLLNSWEEALDTALHEVAHALTANERASHGPLWRAMARELGAKPQAKQDFVFEDRKGELKIVKTNYGPVKIRLGEEVDVQSGVGKLRIVDVRRTKCVGRSALGSTYNLPVDLLHPNYGTNRVPLKQVTLKDLSGKPFSITLGRTTYSHRGVDYTACWITGKRVVCISATGSKIRVDQTLFADKDNS